jgi:hypothetical protein
MGVAARGPVRLACVDVLETALGLRAQLENEIITKITRNQSRNNYWFREVAGGRDCGKSGAVPQHNQRTRKAPGNIG